MACLQKSPASFTDEADSPTYVMGWLPLQDQCENYEGTVVVDFLLAQLIDTSTKYESRRTQKLQATLRLAATFERLLNSGFIKNRAALAARYGVTRARMTQIMALLKLHPDILSYVREVDLDSGIILSERQLRPLLSLGADEQLAAAQSRLPGFDEPSTEAAAC